MRRLGLLTLAMVTAMSAFAQKGVEDGSRYGHGEDSINALRNISIYVVFNQIVVQIDLVAVECLHVFRAPVF